MLCSSQTVPPGFPADPCRHVVCPHGDGGDGGDHRGGDGGDHRGGDGGDHRGDDGDDRHGADDDHGDDVCRHGDDGDHVSRRCDDDFCGGDDDVCVHHRGDDIDTVRHHGDLCSHGDLCGDDYPSLCWFL